MHEDLICKLEPKCQHDARQIFVRRLTKKETGKEMQAGGLWRRGNWMKIKMGKEESKENIQKIREGKQENVK